MDASIKKLQKIIKIMRQSGVIALKMDGIELNLAPSALEQTQTIEEIAKELKIPDQFTPEQMLMWSAPGQMPDEPGATEN